MTSSRIPLSSLPAWRALGEHFPEMREVTLRELFAGDPRRGERLTAEGAGVFLDYSKHLITDRTLELLLALADESGLRASIDAMFRGDRVNVSENRAALHVALRAPRDAVIDVDGRNVVADAHATLDRMATFADQVRNGDWRGHTGKRIGNVVSIGIGGSHLGPAMACEALRHYSDRALTIRFVSNVDGSDLAEAVRDLDPAQTLFIVASKSFATLETMTNAEAARAWLLRGLDGDPGAIGRHFVAVSTNAERVADFGIDATGMFGFGEWVGGRYSMGSAIGLSTMLAIGPQNFRSMLTGFHEMDEHFRTATFVRNLPVLLGLLAIWNNDFLGARTSAVLPYAHSLRRFPAYLQQLVMESNGKHVTQAGQPVACDTAQVIWGEAGSNGQHSFHQLLHQGTQMVPCDFIVLAKSADVAVAQQDLLVANAFAQAESLAFGLPAGELRARGTPEDLVAPRVCEGNRPSSTILLRRLSPAALGRLVALYEHSVFTQAVIWQINPFDQWGVELGKELAIRIAREFAGQEEPEVAHDSSTTALMRRYRCERDR